MFPFLLFSERLINVDVSKWNIDREKTEGYTPSRIE
jgi:hypothetical protein